MNSIELFLNTDAFKNLQLGCNITDVLLCSLLWAIQSKISAVELVMRFQATKRAGKLERDVNLSLIRFIFPFNRTGLIIAAYHLKGLNLTSLFSHSGTRLSQRRVTPICDWRTDGAEQSCGFNQDGPFLSLYTSIWWQLDTFCICWCSFVVKRGQHIRELNPQSSSTWSYSTSPTQHSGFLVTFRTFQIYEAVIEWSEEV